MNKPECQAFRGWLQRIGPDSAFELRHEYHCTTFDAATEEARVELAGLTTESVVEVHAVRVAAPGERWRALALRCLAKAEPLPFLPVEACKAPVSQRARYRYLTLRNGTARQALVTRHQFVHALNVALHLSGFVAVETPLLSAPSASGAREFRVRNADGSLEYALPQSAQLYGQLLVAGGIERYSQWSRCFRDEDLRANRQSEFTQLHLECAFMSAAQLRGLFETLLADACRQCGKSFSIPFEELRYDDAMARYGEDKPDMRWELRLNSLPFVFNDVSHTDEGAPQLAQLLWRAGETATMSIAAVLPEQCEAHGVELLGYATAGLWSERFLPRHWTRTELRKLAGFSSDPHPESFPLIWGNAAALNAVHQTVYRTLRDGPHEPLPGLRCTWIVDYPLFAIDERSPDRLTPVNSPYTAPADPAAFAVARKHRERLQLRSTSFDMVCNGEEVASGSTVINDLESQRSVFDAMALSRREVRVRYGVWMEALRYGVPPMSGIGLGLDRFVACLLDERKIATVIAFPKTKNGYCPVTGLVPNSS